MLGTWHGYACLLYTSFAGYYYGEGDSPYYPADVDDNALRFFGPERYHSAEFQDEALSLIHI